MDRVQTITQLVASASGSSVVPCHPLGKECTVREWPDKGVFDEASIAAAFSDADVNVALVIGEHTLVLDVEGPKKKREASRAGLENLVNLEKRLGCLPPTIQVETPSGGRHLYFSTPKGAALTTKAKLLNTDGIELRTGRAYVIAPPSRVVNDEGEVAEYRFTAGRGPWDVTIAELPPAWLDAITAFQPSTAVYTPQVAHSGDHANREAHWPSIVKGCAFAQWAAGDGAKSLSEPLWYALLNLTSFCKGGRDIAHKVSTPYPQYSVSETDRKFDHSLQSKPYTCDYVSGSLGFDGCQRCPLRATDAKSPIALGYANEVMVEEQARFVYAVDTRRYHDVRTGNQLGFQSVSDLLKSRLGKNPHEQLMRSRCTAKVEGADYCAGDDNLILDNSGRKLLNLWRRDGAAAKMGDASAMFRFFDYLFPDSLAGDHVLDWLSFLHRRTGRKIKHGLIITGPPGTGKSTFNKLVKLLFGVSNTTIVPGERLGSKFKATLVNCEILIAEEARHGERFEVAEDLKELVTAEHIVVEEKHISAFTARTPRGIILTSNWTSPIVLTGNDRRWFVAETAKEMGSNDFFREIYAALDDDVTVPAFAAALLARDLSMYNPDAPPPVTEAKIDAIEGSRTPLAAYLARAVEDRCEPFHKDLVTIEQIEAFTVRLRWQLDSIKVNTQRIASALREIGCEALDSRIRVQGKLIRPWAVRDTAQWRKASTSKIQSEFVSNTSCGQSYLPGTVAQRLA